VKNLWRHVLGLAAFGRSVVIDAVGFDPDAEELVATVRLRRNALRRCGVCGRRSPGYDKGRSAGGPRRWRGLDMGTIRVFLEAEMLRVLCRDHGVVAVRVPWARHGSWFTRDFEDTVGWLATATSKTAVCELMRVGWRTVGGVVSRIQAEIDTRVDRLDGLRRIGIDEISYKRGHKFLTIVVDHDTGNLLWAAVGRNKATLDKFFTLLGPDRCALITHTSADAAPWIAKSITEHCPKSGVLTRFMWSRGRPPRLTSCAVKLGTMPAKPPAPSLNVALVAHLAMRRHGLRLSAPRASKVPVTRYGRTLTTSLSINKPSSPGSLKPTRACTAATSSKKDSGLCSRSKATPANRPLTDGLPGRNDAGYQHSSPSAARSENTAARSTQHSNIDYQTRSSSPPTPKSGYSPEWPTASNALPRRSQTQPPRPKPRRVTHTNNRRAEK